MDNIHYPLKDLLFTQSVDCRFDVDDTLTHIDDDGDFVANHY